VSARLIVNPASMKLNKTEILEFIAATQAALGRE
jgi:hypothetical protein